MPSPIALAPAAHTVETLMHGPRKPRRRLSAAAPAFGITIGTNSGLMRPFSAGFFTPRNSRAPVLCSLEPAEAGAHHDADTAGSTSPSAASASAASAAPSVNCVITVGALGFLVREHRERVEVGDLAAEADRRVGDVEVLDLAGDAAPGEQRCPERVERRAGGRHDADAGDRDPGRPSLHQVKIRVRLSFRSWPSRRSTLS